MIRFPILQISPERPEGSPARDQILDSCIKGVQGNTVRYIAPLATYLEYDLIVHICTLTRVIILYNSTYPGPANLQLLLGVLARSHGKR
jgi:hypothetical protein